MSLDLHNKQFSRRQIQKQHELSRRDVSSDLRVSVLFVHISFKVV